MQSWNIVITSPWQVVTAIVAVATAFTAIDKAWDTLLAKWKKHKAPEEAQNAEISALWFCRVLHDHTTNVSSAVSSKLSVTSTWRLK